MKQIVNIAIRTLLAAATGRAMNVLRKQAEVVRPGNVEYRANAGGWN